MPTELPRFRISPSTNPLRACSFRTSTKQFRSSSHSISLKCDLTPSLGRATSPSGFRYDH